jgi:hypothetical protein
MNDFRLSRVPTSKTPYPNATSSRPSHLQYLNKLGKEDIISTQLELTKEYDLIHSSSKIGLDTIRINYDFEHDLEAVRKTFYKVSQKYNNLLTGKLVQYIIHCASDEKPEESEKDRKIVQYPNYSSRCFIFDNRTGTTQTKQFIGETLNDKFEIALTKSNVHLSVYAIEIIYDTKLWGGCKDKCGLDIASIPKDYYYNPTTEQCNGNCNGECSRSDKYNRDNNCLFDCVFNGTGFGDTIKDNCLAYDETITHLRKMINNPKDPIETKDINTIAIELKTNINLHIPHIIKGKGSKKISEELGYSGKFKLIGQYGLPMFKDEIDIILNKEHYLLVKDKRIFDLERCGCCNKWLETALKDEHMTHCKFCQKCRHCYDPNPDIKKEQEKVLKELSKHYKEEQITMQLIDNEVQKELDKHKGCVQKRKGEKLIEPLKCDELKQADISLMADFETLYIDTLNGEKVKCHNVYAGQNILLEPVFDIENNTLTYTKEIFDTCEAENVIDTICVWYDQLEKITNKLISEDKINKFQPLRVCFFNGANFDFLFIIRELIKRKVKLSKFILQNNNSILSFTMWNECVRFFDLYKFTCPYGLAACCQSFDIDKQYWKSSFDHELIKSIDDVKKYKENQFVYKNNEEPITGMDYLEKIDFINGWKPYLELDVLALAELFIKFKTIIWSKFGFHLEKCVSLPQLGYKIWRNTLSEDVKLYVPSYVADKFMRQGAYGGRSYPSINLFKSKDAMADPEYNKVRYDKIGKKSYYTIREKNMYNETDLRYKNYEDITDCLFDVDISSLYPTAMGKGEFIDERQDEFPYFKYIGKFPVGKEQYFNDKDNRKIVFDELEKEAINPTGKLFGVLRVRIKPNDKLAHSVLPQKSGTGLNILSVEQITKLIESGKDKYDGIMLADKSINSLVWNVKQGAFDGVYTSLDIIRALRKGYELLDVYEGYIWDDAKYIYEEYIDIMYAWKAQAKAEKNLAQYNIAKLLQNSLYGKMLQKPIEEQHILVQSKEEYDDIRDKYIITGRTLLSDEIGLFSVEDKNKEKSIKNCAMLGAFILSGSRLVMDFYFDRLGAYEDPTIIHITDTDSLQIHMKHMSKITDCIVPQNKMFPVYKSTSTIEKECLGMLDFDIKGKIIKYVGVAPKNYADEYITPFSFFAPRKTYSDKLTTYQLLHMRLKGIPYKDKKNPCYYIENIKGTDGTVKDVKIYISKQGFEFYEKMITENKAYLIYTEKPLLKRVGIKPTAKDRDNNIKPFSIKQEGQKKILNKTPFTKRQPHPTLPYHTIPC